MVKEWVAKALWDGLKLFAGQAHNWVFDPERAARRRFRHRKRWWGYKCRAEQTKDKRDDMRAECWRIEFNFETSPDEALKRGDLDPQGRQMAIDAMERNRKGPAADRAKP